MKLHLKNKISRLLILLQCIIFPAFAQQQFKYKSLVQRVDSSRFYCVALQPALTAKCQPSLGDIRLVDEKGIPVPYLLDNTLPTQVQSNYQELPQILTDGLKDSLFSYIVENKKQLSISQLWIKLQNTAVNRTVNLLGSDDLQHWFAIKEQISLQQASAGNKGNFEELLTLPPSTYQYFKIQVNDRNRAPIHIIQIGIYSKHLRPAQYVPLPVASFTNQRKADTSLLNITFNDSYHIDKLHLQLADNKYYQRHVQLYSLENGNQRLLAESLISSTGNGNIYLSGKVSHLKLVILNGDNPPLTINAIQVYQLQQSLVAYLESGHQYKLYYGNNTIRSPKYDLNAFADSLRYQLPIISHYSIVPLYNAKINRSSGVVATWILWVAGGLALLIMLLLTLKMTKEVSQKNS